MLQVDIYILYRQMAALGPTQYIYKKALQMQRDRATRHKYQKIALEKACIVEWPSRTLKVITIAAIR